MEFTTGNILRAGTEAGAFHVPDPRIATFADHVVVAIALPCALKGD